MTAIESEAAEMQHAQRAQNPYLALGVHPYINGAGVRTIHGGSLMTDPVRMAMDAAARHFVDMDELMEGAGQRIAELTGAPWGIVTCGSAAAMSLATAACVTGNDPAKMLRLPFTDGLNNRVVMPKGHRFAYDHAVRLAGAHIVEVETIDELDTMIEPPTAMVLLLGGREATTSFSLEQIATRARPRGVSVLVDAAPEFIERPNPWLGRGADLVVYSGGKYLRGPQTSGLLLGRKPLVEAAWRHASPHLAFGRGMKVSKEDVIGLIRALEIWFEQRDPVDEAKRWRDDLSTIASRLGLPDIDAVTVGASIPAQVPKLRVSWNPDRYPITGEQLWRALLDGTPRIVLREISAKRNAIEIDPFCLEPGEAAIVGEAIQNILAFERPCVVQTRKPAVDISGLWSVHIQFLHGHRILRLSLKQDRALVAGRHRSEGFVGDAIGSVAGDTVRLMLSAAFEGQTIAYRLTGLMTGDRLEGDILLGTAHETHTGPDISAGQFGSARFHALRVSSHDTDLREEGEI